MRGLMRIRLVYRIDAACLALYVCRKNRYAMRLTLPIAKNALPAAAAQPEKFPTIHLSGAA
jgi:hypothetical protein